jgi:hypothetical protein
MHRESLNVQARDAWSEWLSARPWDLFLTLTSDHRSHPEALHKRFRYCTNLMARDVYGRTATRNGRSPVEWINGLERHKSGWPHSHALLRLPDVDVADREQFSLAEWQKRISDTGGYCWLSRPRAQADVVSYVTKYVTKDGELRLSDNLSPAVNRHPALWTLN